MVTNYLDDFLFLAFALWLCNQLIRHFLMICVYLGMPVSEEKMVWGSLRLVFLGILLDGEHKILAVPQEKRDRAVNLLLKFLQSKKATVKDLQSLAGFLNFLCKAIHPGHAFTRQMYSEFSGLVEFEGKLSTIKYEQLGISDELAKKQKVLKPHHHVNLDKEFWGDCEVWLSFLESQDSSVCCPFVDLSSSLQADQLFFYTDSSANPDLGFGAIFGTHWVFGQWEAGFVMLYRD